MAIEARDVTLRIQILNQRAHKQLIDQGVELIGEKVKDHLMMPHKKRELKRMARRGRLVGLVETLDDGTEILGGISGINDVHRRWSFWKFQFGKIQAAELGSVAIAERLSRNGYGREIVQQTAQLFMHDSARRGKLAEGFVLFAMVKKGNTASNGMFDKLGNRIELDVLPQQALRFGRDYYGYDITHQGQI